MVRLGAAAAPPVAGDPRCGWLGLESTVLPPGEPPFHGGGENFHGGLPLSQITIADPAHGSDGTAGMPQ